MKACTKEEPCLLLMVENDSAARKMFEVNVSNRFAELIKSHFAGSCAEATLLLKEANFDVILLELDLPDSKGLKTLDEVVKAVEDKVPIIVFTKALPKGVSEEDVLKHRAQDVILKPGPGAEEMLRLINYAASRHRTRIMYIEMLSSVQRECDDAKRSLNELRKVCLGCALANVDVREHEVIKEVPERVDIPGPTLLRLERIINRIEKLSHSLVAS